VSASRSAALDRLFPSPQRFVLLRLYGLLHNELDGVLRRVARLHHGDLVSVNGDHGNVDALRSQNGGGQDDDLRVAVQAGELMGRDHDRLGASFAPLQHVDGLHRARLQLPRGGQGGQHLGPLQHLLDVGGLGVLRRLLRVVLEQVAVQPDVLVQVGARAEGGGAVGAGVRLLPAVGAGVLREPGGHAEALAANPAAERPEATVDALVVLQVGQLAEALATRGALVEAGRVGLTGGSGKVQRA